MNQFAVRTRNTNLLLSKTQNFKTNHKQSQKKIRSTSSLSNLAGKLYSTSYNQGFSPDKSRAVAKSAKKLPEKKGGLNPELPMLSPQSLIKSTLSMNGLSMRASHITGFAQLNTQLLIEKKQLQKKILISKQSIAHEKKLLNNADYNSKKNMNENQKFTDFYLEANTKSKDLSKKIHHTVCEINQLQQDNQQLNQKIANKNQNIKKERNLCENYEKQVKRLKLALMQEEKDRNKVKADLQKAQRVMESASIYCKQLENERAILLLSINQSVSINKL